MSDLWAAVQEDRRLMKKAVEEASKRGVEYARANAEYYAAKTKRALEMKEEGLPVTLIEASVKGVQDVAEKMLERDCAKAQYQAALKAIDVYRDDTRIAYEEFKRAMAGDSY